MTTINYADEGKVWKSIKDGWIGSNVLILGSGDSLDNYEQVVVAVLDEEVIEDGSQTV